MENEGFTPDEGAQDRVTPLEGASDGKVPLANDDNKDPDGKAAIGDSTSITMSTDEKAPAALTPYAGMGKDDLLRFSQTTFWVRLRLACVLIFWIGWLALLIAVVVLTIATDRCSEIQEKTWWQKSTLYQVYVRSFHDSDADGVGDIKGLIEKLGYVQDLQVDGIILSSIYVSHDSIERDFGYDVIDHKDIDPELGTMDDFELLLEEAKRRDIKVLLEFIPNHTGDQHEWFLASNSSGEASNEYWNYYVWTACTPGVPPTNWRSVLGGSAWTQASANSGRPDECYLHQFFDWQPELNLRSSRVKAELEDILRFWLDKGVDGFRVKNVKYLFEDADMRDEDVITGCTDPDDYNCLHHNYTASQAEIHDMVASWRTLLEEYSTGDHYRLLLTDADDTAEETMQYYGTNGRNGAHLPINYQLSNIDRTCGGDCVKEFVDWSLSKLPRDATANWLTGHQDGARLAGVMGDEFVNALMLLKFTLPGVVLTYYGEEIGMINGNASGQDPAEQINADWSRDPYRSPMQWTDDEYAGFGNLTAILPGYEPWLPVNSGYRDLNAETQQSGDRFTHLRFYKELVELHRNEEGLHYGGTKYISTGDQSDAVFAFLREIDGQDRFLAAFNFGNNTREVNLAHDRSVPRKADVLLTTSGHNKWFQIDDHVDLERVTLRAGDGILFTWPYSR